MGWYKDVVKMTEIFSIFAGIGSGLLGSMGMGGGGVLIIYLNLFTDINQKQAQGINLLFFIPIAILATLVYQRKKLIVWKIAIPFSIFGILGSYLGAYSASYFDSNLLRNLFGIFLIFIGLKELLVVKKKRDT